MINLIHGNSLDVLKTFADNSIDVVFTSPPYNARLRINKGKYVKRPASDKVNQKYSDYSDDLSLKEYEDFLSKIIDQCLRISSLSFINIQFLSGNKVAVHKIIGKYAESIKEWFIWDKGHGQPAIKERVVNSCFEMFLILANDETDAKYRQFKTASFERGTFSNILRVNPRQSIYKNHSASMPLELIELILKNFTSSNQTICDPFMGTGSTGVVCKKLNLNFIGIELSQDYYDVANQRINEPVQLDLFT